MSFDTYSWPSPWESTNNKKNPFDTQNTSQNQDTSAFNTDKKQLSEQDTSMFDTKEDRFWQLQDTSNFDTKKVIKNDKWFIYFNPEGLPSTRKNNKRINKIVQKHLIKKYKVSERKKEDILNLLSDINTSDIKEVKKIKDKKTDIKKQNITNDIDNINFELVDPEIWEENKKQISNLDKKDTKIKSFDELVLDIKKDLKEKEKILEKDKNHNLHIKTLKEQWKTKNQILSILNQENKPKFIKYEKNYETIWLNKKVAQTAIALVEKKDNLWALHCTDWVNRIYKKVAHERVYDSHTIFNWVKHISKWTWIWAEQYASKSVISSIQPWEHIMVDLPVDWEYNNWKTHSVIALSQPNDWLIEVASYPKYWANPIIEMYDLYWLGRAKSAKPIRIQSA